MTTDRSRHLMRRSLLMLVTLVVASCTGQPAATTPGEAATTTTNAAESSDDIPNEFPQPEDTEDFDVLEISSDDIHVQWEVAASPTETAAFYDQALPDNDWEIMSRRQGGDSTRYSISGHGWEGAVTVLGGDSTKVVLQLGRPDNG